MDGRELDSITMVYRTQPASTTGRRVTRQASPAGRSRRFRLFWDPKRRVLLRTR